MTFDDYIASGNWGYYPTDAGSAFMFNPTMQTSDNGQLPAHFAAAQTGNEYSNEQLARMFYDKNIASGRFGTAGLNFNDAGGFFDASGTRAPVNIGGVDYARTGEDVSAPGWMQNFLKSAKPEASYYTNQWGDPSTYALNNAEYGPLMRMDRYAEAQRLADAAKSEGMLADNAPIRAALETIGRAYGIYSGVSTLGGMMGLGETAASAGGGALTLADAGGATGTMTDAGSVAAGTMGGDVMLPEINVTASPISTFDPVSAAALVGGGAAAASLAGGGDETGAFDSGQFRASDVGLGESFDGTGAFDSGMFLPSDVGLDNVSYPGGGGGGGFSLTSGVDSGAYFSEVPPTDRPYDFMDRLKDATIPKDAGDALSKLLRAGPGLLGAAGMLQQRSAADKFAQQIAAIGGPQRELGNQLLNAYKSGQLSPADASRIAQWEQSATAQMRQYFARAGTANSTQARSAANQIKAQAEAMRQQALQGMLTQGTNMLNITDRYQAAALEAEMRADASAVQAAVGFLGAYGAWLRTPATKGA